MQVTPTHAFGIHGPIRDNIVIYKHDRDKEGVIFPVGSQLVAFDPEENKMNFFERKQNDNDAITALALSSTKNQVVAAAFYGSSNDGAQIRIFKTNNRQNISTLLHRSKINSMCFSGDSKLLICASEESITIWSWEKEKLDYSESITGSITRLSCPLQSITSFDLLISSTGTCHARIWVASSRHRLNNFMIMQNKAKEQKFIFQDHTWLKSNDNEDNLRLAVVMEPRRKTTGSDSASLSDISIAIYQVNENPTSTRPSLDLEETICIDEKIKIFSIAPFQSSPGFYLGGSKGTLLAFEREQDRNGEVTFTKSHHLRQDMDENFISVQAFNTNNDNLLVLSDAMKLYTCCIGNSENPKDDENVFIPFISNDHCGGIVDIDCSLEKSLLVSCGGIENKILICDYDLRQCNISHDCHADEPRSITVHPSGHQIVVGFKDKMIMYHILIDRLKSYREMACKICHKVMFSPLGQYFAAVLGNGISIYATYQGGNSSSFLLLHSFTGHVGPVKSLSWANDNILFSAGIDKNIYGWDMQHGTRVDSLNVLRSFGNCNALVAFSSNKRLEVAACTSDGGVYRIDCLGTEKCEVKTLIRQSEDVPVSICLNEERSILYVGTTRGVIRCINWNINTSEMTCFQEIYLHNRHSLSSSNSINPAIRSIRVARNCLITAGGIDGSIFLSLTGQNSNNKSLVSSSSFQNDNIVLITLEDYKQSKDLVVELEQQIITLNNDHEFALHSKDALWRNEIKELTDKTDEIVEAEHARHDELQKKYEDTIKSHVLDLNRKDDTHDMKSQELEQAYEKRLAKESSNYDELKKEIIKIQDEFTTKLEKQKALHDHHVQTIKNEFTTKEKRLKANICKLEEESKESDKIFNEILDQQEEEYEMELLNLKAKADERLHQDSLRNQNMKGAVQTLSSKRNQLSRLNDELKSKHINTEETYRRECAKRKQIQIELEKEKELFASLQVQLDTKDKDIKALQADKKALTNFKYLLESQIEDMQQEKVPVNECIQSLNQQIIDLKCNLEAQRNEMTKKDLQLDQRDMKLRSQTKNVKSLEQTIRLLKREFIILSGLIDSDDTANRKLLKDRLNMAYQKYRISEN